MSHESKHDIYGNRLADIIKRPFIHPNDRTDDQKLALLYGSHKAVVGKVFTEAQDKNKKRQYKESAEQGSLFNHIDLYYPDVEYMTSRIEGKKEFWEQNLIKKLNKRSGYPDIFIAEPRGGFAGLYIESKKEGTSLFQVRKPTVFASPHLANQYNSHQKLIAKRYAVYFGIGALEQVEIFEAYMRREIKPFLIVPGFKLEDYKFKM